MNPARASMIIFVLWHSFTTTAASQEASLELVGGKWFDGAEFVDRTAYVSDGFFVRVKPQGDVQQVDLDGRYIVPPFADGHSHNLASEWEWQRTHDAYLEEGTFYVLVMGNARSGSEQMRARFMAPNTVDIAFAEGAVTSTLGYPFMHYEPRAMGLHDPSTWSDHLPAIRQSRLMENDGYFFVDSLTDVEASLSGILANRTSLLKIILFRSEQFTELTADTARLSHRGLSPALVPEIVARAHAAGVRVAAHVETAHDFALAVRAGVDIIAHLPGYNLGRRSDAAPFELTEAIVRLAGERAVILTPTIHFGRSLAAGDPEWSQRRDSLVRHNLGLLKKHGVRVAAGTDIWQETARPEIDALHALGLWSNVELLRMWSVTTPRLVFPTRRIGSLEPGFEASFLALECDPLVNFDCTRRIVLRFKQGQFLP